MASWSNPVAHTTGDVFAVSDYTVLANNETFLYQAPYAAYYNSVATSLVNSATTQVTLGGTDFSGYGWSVSSNNAVVPLTAIFHVEAAIYTPQNAGILVAEIYQNGSQVTQGTTQTGSAAVNNLSLSSRVVKCSASDTLGLYGFQNSGGAVNTTAAKTVTYLHAFVIGST